MKEGFMGLSKKYKFMSDKKLIIKTIS